MEFWAYGPPAAAAPAAVILDFLRKLRLVFFCLDDDYNNCAGAYELLMADGIVIFCDLFRFSLMFRLRPLTD